MPDIPSCFDRGTFGALDPDAAHAAVRAMAAREIMNVGEHDPASVYVEKQSFHPDDWYLWTAAAMRPDGRWDMWTLNLTSGSLSYGHYCLDLDGAKRAMAMKKGVDVVQPD